MLLSPKYPQTPTPSAHITTAPVSVQHAHQPTVCACQATTPPAAPPRRVTPAAGVVVGAMAAVITVGVVLTALLVAVAVAAVSVAVVALVLRSLLTQPRQR
ncbi:hypothetical protein SAMN05216267_102078 [Actinacidiphila rubida]|uniref:SpdD protein n=1 Tax=Actinacidiphila rubida TaxID=310780 RepID=A0A1H8MY81_9ACTN|nr:hypothetical protein SAMN05216267_102078 [Actinacidiphila rubida]